MAEVKNIISEKMQRKINLSMRYNVSDTYRLKTDGVEYFKIFIH